MHPATTSKNKILNWQDLAWLLPKTYGYRSFLSSGLSIEIAKF